MLLDFILKRNTADAEDNFLSIEGRRIPLAVVRSHRARRYLLRLRPDGSARLTIPRRGSVVEGRRFAERNKEWLARQLAKLPTRPPEPKQWLVGTEILFRGELVKLEAGMNGETGAIQFGGEMVRVPDVGGDLRLWIVKHLWKLAATEFPPRVFERATAHQLTIRRVTVRNQTIPVGFLLAARHHLIELAADSNPAVCPGLHHPPRTDAPASDEPLGAFLAGSGKRLSGSCRRRKVAETKLLTAQIAHCF